MAIDEERLVELIQERGKAVVSATYDGGAPGYSGSASVVKFAGVFWSFDDNGEFGGPFDTLRDALADEHLSFGEVAVSIEVTGMATSTYAAMMRGDGPESHSTALNGEEWSVGEDGELGRTSPPRGKRAKRKRKA